MQPHHKVLVAIAHRFLDVLLNFSFPPLDVRLLHRDEDLVQTRNRRVLEVFRERYFREQGQLGLALKMGRDFRIINRLTSGNRTFYDRKQGFARGIAEKTLLNPTHAAARYPALNRRGQHEFRETDV